MSQEEPTNSGSLRQSNRLVVGILLAVMALMATFGLLYALQTVDLRRSRDPKPEPTAEQPRSEPKVQ